MRTITFVTGNIKKLEQVKEYVDFPLDHMKVDITEIQATNAKEIVTHKAREAYKQINKPVLVEDVSLRFEYLGNLPGPFVKWFIKELGLDKMCRLLDNAPDRKAVAEIVYAYYDGSEMQYFSGETHGTIAAHPQGDESFGWNAIFIPNGETRTWGEMTNAEKETHSMRKQALIKFEKYLETYGK